MQNRKRDNRKLAYTICLFFDFIGRSIANCVRMDDEPATAGEESAWLLAMGSGAEPFSTPRKHLFR